MISLLIKDVMSILFNKIKRLQENQSKREKATILYLQQFCRSSISKAEL